MAKANAENAWTIAARGLVGGLCATLVFSFALNSLMLSMPLYSLQMFDRVLGSGSAETLILLTMMAGMALVAFGLFEMVRTSLLARLASRFELRLARPLVEAAARQGVSGALGLRDLTQVRQGLTGPAMMALLDAPWLPAALVLVWVLHPMLAAFTAASVVALAVMALLNDLLTRRLQHLGGKAQQEAHMLIEALARKGEVARAMGMVEPLAGRVGRLHGASLVGQQRAAERGGVILGLTRALRLGVQIGVTGLGAWLVLKNEITPGAMLASSILASKALAPVEQMVGVWRMVTVARDSWARLRRLLSADDAAQAATSLPRPKGELVVESVSARGSHGRLLLHNLSFALQPGECLGVVGPSGAGKSTLCRLLIGAIAPDAGSIRLDAARLEHYPSAELGAHVGYLPQEAMLFAGTVNENIARMAPDPDPEAVVAAAQLAGAHKMILRLGEGYETRIDDGGAPLSGGQRQWIGLARALYGSPRLVVLDEPNANLDGHGEAALAATLDSLKEAGITTILVTHRPQVLQRTDKILVLEDGRASGFGPRDTVLQSLIRPALAA
jgi:PrtD family type I secretion system ABC transporter